MNVNKMKRARLAAMGVRFVEGEDGQAGNGPASENSGQQPPQQQEAPSGPKGGARENGEHGYPTSTPLTEMTVEQREAYWRHQSKKHEQTWKSVIDRNLTPEQVLEMQQRLDEVNRERMSDHEKQVADARREAAAEATAQFAPRLARAAVEAALARAGVPEDRIDNEIEWTDLSKFLTPKGDVDTGMVSQFAESRRAPKAAADDDGGSKKKFPDMGGGKRGPLHESAKARAEKVARERGWVRDAK